MRKNMRDIKAKKIGLDIQAISARSQHWKEYEPQLKQQLTVFGDSPWEVAANFFRGLDLARRYCRQKLWTQFRFNVLTGQMAGAELDTFNFSTAKEKETYREIEFFALAYTIAESLYNTLANARDQARDVDSDVYLAMYEALWNYLREDVQALYFLYIATWDQAEAVTSLSGWIASKATTKSGKVRYASYHKPLSTEYHRNKTSAPTSDDFPHLPNSTAEGLLSEIPAEAAAMLITRLREAEVGNTPSNFDLNKITNEVLNNIRINLGETRLTAPQIENLFKEQEGLSVEEEARGFIRAEEMRREAKLHLAPAEWKVFQLLEQPGITENEIAVALGVTVGSVKTQKSRLRKKLNAAGWKIA